MFNNIFTKGITIIVCWIIFLGLGTYLFNFSVYPKLKELNGNQDLPEERFGFAGDYFYSVLNKVGKIGQSSYLQFQIFDYINGILLSFTLFVTIYYLLNKLEAKKVFKFLLVFPFLLGIFDVLENTVFIYLTWSLPKRFVQIASFASDITTVKLIFGAISFFTIVIILLVFVFKIIYKKVKPN